jgi:hypothetical protein
VSSRPASRPNKQYARSCGRWLRWRTGVGLSGVFVAPGRFATRRPREVRPDCRKRSNGNRALDEAVRRVAARLLQPAVHRLAHGATPAARSTASCRRRLDARRVGSATAFTSGPSACRARPQRIRRCVRCAMLLTLRLTVPSRR